MRFDEDFQPARTRSRWGLPWWAVIVVSALTGALMAIIGISVVPRWQADSLREPGRTEIRQVSLETTSAIVHAVNQVKPAIVGIVNIGKAANPLTNEMVPRKQGMGSGVLFDASGLIVTNHHVVAGASAIEAVLSSGKRIQARLVGADPLTDLAVLRVPAGEIANVRPAVFGDSSTLQPGEPAIAIGNPLGLEQTVTVGVISATKRMLPLTNSQGEEIWEQDVIQTDAAINPGNSGGALCNIGGQVIGINSEKIASRGVEGLGFAIPSNEVKRIVGDLVRHGKVIRPGIGIKGRSLEEIPEPYRPEAPVESGVFVIEVNAQAHAAGLKPGDVIVALDGQPVRTILDLRKQLFAKKPGDTVTVTLYRGARKIRVQEFLNPL
jgi:serine protease Do